MSLLRRRPGKEAAALVDAAIEELGADLTAQEVPMFADLRARLSSGANVPVDYLVLAYKALGGRAAGTGRSALTVRLYEAALTLDPGDATFHYDLGNHLAKIGRSDDAIAAYGRALDRDPELAWASYNRGRLLYELGRVDEALDDFERSARSGCDAPGFHGSVARRFIRERGFRAFLTWILDASLPGAQPLHMVRALSESIFRAGAFGGWYLASPVSAEATHDETLQTLQLRARLADILRESPCGVLVGGLHMGRSAEGYKAQVLTAEQLAEAVWYRPASWGVDGPEPDRVAHLKRLAEVLQLAEDGGELEAAWAAHYMSGAIALSTLLGGRTDWATPVIRLSVALDIPRDGPSTPVAARVAEIEEWVGTQPGAIQHGERGPQALARFAMGHFREASEALVTLRMRRAEPPMKTALLVEDDGSPVMRDGEWATGSMALNVASEIWSSAEPVFREWVTAAEVRQDAAEYVAATSRARRFNALAGTELWGDLEPEEWRACRRRLAAAYEPEVSVADLRSILGAGGVLLDYYVHEVVEDTIVRLALSALGSEVSHMPVDTIAGDLAVLLEAHRPGEMPAEGLAGRVDELLLGDAGHHLRSAKRLAIVPFGYLRNVPFHALSTARDAIDRGDLEAISYLPSTALATAFRSSAGGAGSGSCLFVGFDPSGDIDIDYELSVVRARFPNAAVLRDRDASLDRVLQGLATHDLVHFACHGDVDAAVRAGYLELADARLYPWHLLNGERTPETVVLNSCLTGSTEVFEPTSDEAFGLHSAFLATGTRHVIGGLWEINEWSARHFARAFYDAGLSEAGVSPAVAVVRAQKALRDETDDPFLWAPHGFFGDWR